MINGARYVMTMGVLCTAMECLAQAAEPDAPRPQRSLSERAKDEATRPYRWILEASQFQRGAVKPKEEKRQPLAAKPNQKSDRPTAASGALPIASAPSIG